MTDRVVFDAPARITFQNGLEDVDVAGSIAIQGSTTAPSVPSPSGVQVYQLDSGAGQTQLMARFATGADQIIAKEGGFSTTSGEPLSEDASAVLRLQDADGFVRVTDGSYWTYTTVPLQKIAGAFRADRHMNVKTVEFTLDGLLALGGRLDFTVYLRSGTSTYEGVPSAADGDVVAHTSSHPVSEFVATNSFQPVNIAFPAIAVAEGQIFIAELVGYNAAGALTGVGCMRTMVGTAGLDDFERGYTKRPTKEYLPVVSGYALAWRAGVLESLAIEEALDGIEEVRVAGAELSTVVDSVLQIEPEVSFSRPTDNSHWTYATPVFGTVVVGHRPSKLESVMGVGLTLDGLAGVHHLEIEVYTRPYSSTYVGGPSKAGGDTLVSSWTVPSTFWAATNAFQDVTILFPHAVAANPDTIVLTAVGGRLVTNADVAIGSKRTTAGTSGLAAWQRGYYRAVGGTAWVAVTTGYAFAFEAIAATSVTLTSSGAAAPALEGITGTVTDGTTMDLDGFQVFRAGSWEALSGSVTVAAEPTGYARYDLIQYNRHTLVATLKAGTPRQKDAEEYIPVPDSNNVALFHVLLNGGVVTTVPVWQWDGVVKRGAEGEYLRMRDYVRRCLPKTLARLQRGLAVTLAGYGDSITAWQAGAPPYTANGTSRDRDAYLQDYGTDTVAAQPRYDHGDGAGAVHVHLSFNWVLAGLLEAAYGSTITYLNFGIASTTTANTLNNGLYPARIAEVVSAAPHVVVLAFGMNESGATTTYANTVSIINQLKAVGSEVIVLGCPRPHATHAASAGWIYTSQALEGAARDTGSAWVPTGWQFESQNLGAVGMAEAHLCSANTANHPGIREHRALGRLLASMLTP